MDVTFFGAAEEVTGSMHMLSTGEDDDRFVLFAQPIKPLQTGETAPRYEILVRMLDEQDNVLPPNEFLSAAERYQLMGAIDRWVVRRTLDQLSEADNPLEVDTS